MSHIKRFVLSFLSAELILVLIFGLYIRSTYILTQKVADQSLLQLQEVLIDKFEKSSSLEAFLHALGEEEMRALQTGGVDETFQKRFHIICQEFHDSANILSLQISPNGIVQYVYPADVGREVIGLSVFDRENQQEDALAAREQNTTIISGPIDLIQGGTAMIALNPVYYEDGTFWGFTEVLLDIPQVYLNNGLDALSAQGYQYRLTCSTNGTERTLASTYTGPQEFLVSADASVYNRALELQVFPEIGRLFIPIFLAMTLLIVVLCSFYTYLQHKSLVANETKNDFLSTMSHDMRTPMNAIVGLCTLLEKDAEDPARTKDHAKKIAAASTHLLGLINDILDMNSLRKGKIKLVCKPFLLAGLEEDLACILKPQIAGKNQTLSMDFGEAADLCLYADPLRLNQILLNLLSNAMKYSDEGKEISLKVRQLDDSTQHTAHLQFIVSDQGMGMSEEFLKKIFVPFSRATDGRVDKIQGTGLGMSITKQLVELMHGSISMQSQLNVGTTATVDLHLKRAGADEIAEESISAIPPDILSGCHVLAAEDNPLNGEILQEFLAMKGADCDLCVHGEEAVRRFVSSPPGTYDLILLDVQMPVMNGLEAARRIRSSKHKDGSTIPIFAMTANAYEEDKLATKRAGMDEHISKPLRIEDIERAFAHVKRGKRQGQTTLQP